MSSISDGLPAERATAPAWGELIVLSGPRLGTRWLLHSPAQLLGQQEGCDYHLDDPDVSPVHAVIVSAPDGAVLRDLFSESGSFVNGESVAEARLRDGDLI